MLPLPAAASSDLVHAHLHFTLAGRFKLLHRQLRPTDMPGCASTKRKAISFDIKKEVIARKDKEEGNTAIGRDVELSESSVRTIWRKRNEIHASIKA